MYAACTSTTASHAMGGRAHAPRTWAREWSSLYASYRRSLLLRRRACAIARWMHPQAGGPPVKRAPRSAVPAQWPPGAIATAPAPYGRYPEPGGHACGWRRHAQPNAAEHQARSAIPAADLIANHRAAHLPYMTVVSLSRCVSPSSSGIVLDGLLLDPLWFRGLCTPSGVSERPSISSIADVPG